MLARARLPVKIDRKSHRPHRNDDPVVTCEACGCATRFSEQSRYQSRYFFEQRRFCSRQCASTRTAIPLADMYERHVIRESQGCWKWKGPVGTNGYPVLRKNRRDVYAHRYACEQASGAPIPAGMVVMHSCDNPICTNPDHLRVATHSENTRDMHAKGRWRRKS